MIKDSISFSLRNFPVVAFAAAILMAAVTHRGKSVTERLLSWVLLLGIGATGLWAGLTHVFFPARAATHIGWELSPFQFEVGMADLAIGITACMAFWRQLEFKAATVVVAAVFLLGDAIGHVRQMVQAGNFTPGNAGVPFYMDIICPLVALALLARAFKRSRVSV
jgi:hypothetical protein